MTPTTASPSLVLLNPTAPTAKSVVAADAGSTPDAVLSGFELLLGAMQQLQQKLPTGTAENNTASKNSDKTTAESGNTLPLLGTILPLSALPPAAPDETAKADAAGTTKFKDDKDQDANIAAANLMSPAPAGLVIQPPLPHGGATKAATEAVASTSVLAKTDVALTTQPRAIRDTKADSADNKTAAPIPAVAASPVDTTVDANAVAPLPVDANSAATVTAAAANGVASMFTVGANSTDAAAGVKAAGPIPTIGASSVDAAVGLNVDPTATAVVKEVQGVSKHSVESDFDTLVKHFDASDNQPTLSTATIGDSPNAHQASRTYANAASNAASVSVPVGNSGWSDAVADKVMWFSANKISSAEIHLNPPDLGPLQVRVSTQHDQASVVFTSQHAAVRDALDQALPRLREMMGSQGMHLLDVSVGGQSAQQQQQFTRNNSDRGASFGGFSSDEPAETAVATVTTVNTARLMRSGVDAYA